MLLDWLLIVLGLATMLFCADLLVRGSVWIALALGISPMVVGLTLVAFGTSAPELFVGVISIVEGRHGFATGNVFGSNVANLGLILGVTATLSPIRHDSSGARFELVVLVIASTLVVYPLSVGGEITRWQGAILIGLLLFFTTHLIRRERRITRELPHRVTGKGAKTAILNTGFVVAGFAGLTLGAEILVSGASGVASRFGMSDTLIGVTIFALGTSGPELVTSIVAARKGHPELALGNVLGSNIFNICMVLGVIGVIEPTRLSWFEDGPSAVLGIVMSTILLVILRIRHGVPRWLGILFLATYVGYLGIAIYTI